MAQYVQTLEEARDTAELPEASGEAIAREFERYLRRRDGGPGQAPGGHATESGDASYLRDTSGGRTKPPKPQRPDPGRPSSPEADGSDGDTPDDPSQGPSSGDDPGSGPGGPSGN